MPNKGRTEGRDRRLAELATAQHGVVSAQQMLKLGHSRAGIAEAAKAGRLLPLHRGVYAVGHKRPARLHPLGPGAALPGAGQGSRATSAFDEPQRRRAGAGRLLGGGALRGELDVYETHGTHAAFERDRPRHEELLLIGVEMIRITGPRLKREPERVMERLGRLLAQRRRELAASRLE